MKYKPKKVQYPIYREEYRIVTPTGVVSCVFDSEQLARERFKDCPAGWHLVRMTMLHESIAKQPCCHKEVHHPHLSLVA